jgi:glycosyltransferase 2 family protein
VTFAAGEAPTPRSRARRIGGWVAGLLIVAALGGAVIGGWENVSSYDWRFDLGFLAVGVLAATASLAATAIGYVLILEQIAGRRLPRLRLVAVWGKSMLARYVPGNLLMVVSRVVLGREAGVPGRVSLAASIYEQVFVLGVSAIASVGLLLGVGNVGENPWLWVVAVVPLGLVLLHPRVFGRVSNALLRRFGRPELEDFLSVRQAATFMGLYAVAAGLLGFSVWATVRGLAGPEVGGPLYVGSGFLLSFVISMLAFVFPSGLGVREGVFALVLARDLPASVAIAAAGAARVALTLVEIAFTGAVVALQRRRREPRRSPSASSAQTAQDRDR